MVRVAPLVLAGSLLLVGCGSEGSSSSPPEGSSTTDPSGRTTTSSAGPSGTTDRSTGTTEVEAPDEVVGDPSTADAVSPDFPESGPPSYLADVRLDDGDGYQRIVFVFARGLPPTYQVRYVDEPPILPSGRTVDVDGEAYLEIAMSPASGVDLSGAEPEQVYEGPTEIPAPSTDGGVVVELVQVEDFESRLTWVVGLSEQVPFAVDTADDPSRLVIDLVS